MNLLVRPLIIQCCLLALLIIPWSPDQSASAQQVNALAQCREQSLELDQIHNCMDRYLDALDGNMQAINEFLGQSLGGTALSGLNRSQRAFMNYRQQNCLWYLEFSSPRSDAEQIAKNCLASMTRGRLDELQGLVSSGEDDDGRMVEGFYVFGDERNSFQPCGSDSRYWVEGNANAVGLLQQNYLSEATSDRQLLYAVVVGALDDEEPTFEDHAGVLQITNLIELRVPTDLDCGVPSPPTSAQITDADIDVPETAVEVFDDEQEPQEEPEQQLIAYFGDWTVDCTEFSGLRSCALGVELLTPGAQPSAEESSPRMTLNRTAREGTFVEVNFPDREIDSPTLIRWQVDQVTFGDVVSSEIRVDELGARQLISESPFLTDELMPALIEGAQVNLDILQSVDDESGEELTGTLQGLTKALGFADDFVREQG